MKHPLHLPWPSVRPHRCLSGQPGRGTCSGTDSHRSPEGVPATVSRAAACFHPVIRCSQHVSPSGKCRVTDLEGIQLDLVENGSQNSRRTSRDLVARRWSLTTVMGEFAWWKTCMGRLASCPQHISAIRKVSCYISERIVQTLLKAHGGCAGHSSRDLCRINSHT